jgi:hypothetical protein
LSSIKYCYELSLAEHDLINAVFDLALRANPKSGISLGNELVHLLVIEIVIFNSLKIPFKTYQYYLKRDHSLKWPTFDQKVLIFDASDDAVHHLTLHRLKCKCLEAHLVYDFPSSVLDSSIRNIFRLDPIE